MRWVTNIAFLLLAVSTAFSQVTTTARLDGTVTDPQGLDTTVAVYDVDTAKKPDPNLFVINYTSNLK